MIFAILERFLNSSHLWDRSEQMLDDQSDEALMLAFAKGQEKAFELLVQRHEQKLHHFALRFLSSIEEAEDITQEVFFKVCKVSKTYTPKARFTTWLYTIARNLCIDHLRRQSHRRHLSLNTPEEDGRAPKDWIQDPKASLAHSDLLKQEFRKRLDTAIQSLPLPQREVFLMREISGLKFKEIAQVIGVSENTVKSRMRYALQSLRKHLADYQGFSFDQDVHR